MQITCGWLPSEAFEFTVSQQALLALVELGTDALLEMARYAEPE